MVILCPIGPLLKREEVEFHLNPKLLMKMNATHRKCSAEYRDFELKITNTTKSPHKHKIKKGKESTTSLFFEFGFASVSSAFCTVFFTFGSASILTTDFGFCNNVKGKKKSKCIR